MDAGTFTATSGWSGFESYDLFDADSSSFDTAPLLGLEDYDQFSQEFRFTSPGGEFIDYIFGAFYQTSELVFDESTPLNVRNGAVADSGNCAIDTAELVQADLVKDFTIDSDAWSAFFQLTFNWNEQWRTTLGLRYVEETKDGFRDLRIPNPPPTDPRRPVVLAILDSLLINEHTLERTRDVGVTLPSVNVQWDITDNIMMYLTYTEGAKSGSFDARNNNDSTGPQGGGTNFEFEDELAEAWELGAKMRLADGAAELNVAIYRVEYSDMQVSVFDGVAGFAVTNAGTALTQGIEIDGRWLVAEPLMLTAAIAYLDFEWLDYVDGPCFPGNPEETPEGTCDLTGDVNQQTPEWTATLTSTYTQHLGNGLRMDYSMDLSYKGEHFTSGDLDPRGIQSGETKVNARIALGADDESWNIALVGKNITNKTTFGITSPTVLDVGGFRAALEPDKAVYLEARARF